MKKIVITAFAIITTCVMLTGCNKQILDTTFSYDKAIVYLPNGEVVEGKVESWTNYEDCDQIQVEIDGTVYLVHSMNVALISE